MKKFRTLSVFMNGIDWQHEVGEAPDGTKIYPTLKALKKYQSSWESSGVVRCEIQGIEWVVPQDFSKKKYLSPMEAHLEQITWTEKEIAKWQTFLARLHKGTPALQKMLEGKQDDTP